MNSPSFEGFHAQLDCKLTNGNKNQTQLTLVLHIKFEFKNKTEQNRNDKKYSQSGITVIIHTNHDGVMPRSNVASSEIASDAFPMSWVVKATSVTATEFYGSVIPSNLHVPVNSAAVHS